MLLSLLLLMLWLSRIRLRFAQRSPIVIPLGTFHEKQPTGTGHIYIHAMVSSTWGSCLSKYTQPDAA